MNLSPLPIQKFFANNGRPLAGGLLFTYAAGTDTKIATYTDSSGLSQNTNPIVLDFRGECRLWIDPQQAYKFVLSPPGDTDPPTRPIWTVDNITAAPQAFDNAAVDTGSVNNISLNIPQISSPVAFTRVVFQAANTNTGPTTMQINGGSALPLVWQSDVRFSGNEITAGGIYQAIFDGGSWQLQGPTLSPCDLRLFGAIPDGTTDCSAALTAASAASAAGRGDIVIKGGTYRLSNSVTIARGATISFEGGMFTIDSARVLTISGTLQAPRTQIFSGDGTVSLTFGGGSAVEVWSEWWGAIPDGVTNCTSAINKALVAGSQLILRLAAGTYKADNIELDVATSIVGVNKDESIISSLTVGQWLMRLNKAIVTPCLLTLRNFTLDGGNIGTVGLQFNNCASFSITDLVIKRFTSKAVYSHGSLIWESIRCDVNQSPIGYDFDADASPPNQIAIRGGRITDCTAQGIRADRSSLLVIDGVDIEANGIAGNTSTMAIYIKNGDPDGLGITCVIKDCWMENDNGLGGIVIDKPLSNNSKHIIQSTQIFGGTRTSGVHVGGGSSPNTWIFIENVHIANATTQDLLIGSNVFGSVIQCAFSTSSINAGASLIFLTDISGNYRFGPNNYFMDAGAVAIKDGVTAPATQAGFGVLYIDSADGDLKIKFGDGVVKTIVTDT